MTSSTAYKGSCFCGSVQFELAGNPEAMAYCHCNSCRHWSASPVSAFTLWKPEAMKITRGREQISSFDKNPGTGDEAVVSQRQWCRDCGGHLFTDHPTMGLIDVPAVVIEGLEFKPGFHVHYQESVHRLKDGLPKFQDLPLEAGGSGHELAE
ncbi:MAG: GFA family protein [Candidatus Sedimenticola sp. PURPLELP]